MIVLPRVLSLIYQIILADNRNELRLDGALNQVYWANFEALYEYVSQLSFLILSYIRSLALFNKIFCDECNVSSILVAGIEWPSSSVRGSGNLGWGWVRSLNFWRLVRRTELVHLRGFMSLSLNCNRVEPRFFWKIKIKDKVKIK